LGSAFQLKEKNEDHFLQRKTIKKESPLPKRAKGVMARFPVIFLSHKLMDDLIKK